MRKMCKGGVNNMRGSWERRMERMVVKRMRKQHKGEGRGGWVDIKHCDEDTCITNSKYTKKSPLKTTGKLTCQRACIQGKSHWPCDLCKRATESHPTEWKIHCNLIASFPGPARLSLAVQNLHRRRGLVHHVMCAAGRVFMSADNNVCRVAYMYIGVSSLNKSSAYDRL